MSQSATVCYAANSGAVAAAAGTGLAYCHIYTTIWLPRCTTASLAAASPLPLASSWPLIQRVGMALAAIAVDTLVAAVAWTLSTAQPLPSAFSEWPPLPNTAHVTTHVLPSVSVLLCCVQVSLLSLLLLFLPAAHSP